MSEKDIFESTKIETLDLMTKYGMTKTKATQYLADWIHNNGREYGFGKDLNTLAKAGANVNVAVDGRTALMTVCEGVSSADEKKALGEIKCLMEHGADINKQDKNGMTALMYSLKNVNELGGNVAVVTELLKHHPDLTLKDNSGKTVIDMAKACMEEAKERGDALALNRYQTVYGLLKDDKQQVKRDLSNQQKIAEMTKLLPNASYADIDRQVDNRLNAKQSKKVKQQTKSLDIPARGNKGNAGR